MRWNHINSLSDKEFVRATGVSYFIFRTLTETVEDALGERKYPGRPPALSVEDQILLTLMYYRHYPTMFILGLIYEVSESTVHYIIDKIETVLSEVPEFSQLRSKKLAETDPETENTYIVDATEVQIERPKTDQESFYSGKKKAFLKGSVGH